LIADPGEIGILVVVVAGAALGLLFVGIHNAWDAVSYHVFVHRQKDQD